MIVWGGSGPLNLNTGGRYNPITDAWTATQLSNAPSPRAEHTAIWTGTEMIVWGGRDFNTGGRYNPNTDSWTSTSTTNAPTGRYNHTAVWTGSAMIVWGGTNGDTWFDTGGRYRPSTDTWTATSRAVTGGTYVHTAVWTSREMIIWAGGVGGRYNPSINSWSTVSTTNAPSYRTEHTAVWTGSEMIVWGGEGNGYLNTGGRYCAQRPTPIPTPPPPLTIMQPNGGEVWLMGSVHQIKWNSTNLKHSDHLILQYSRDGGASWFRIAQDIPAFTFGYWWHVDNFPTTQGRVKILLQEDRSITDQSDANFTVQRP